jgi:hypothetical protein
LYIDWSLGFGHCGFDCGLHCGFADTYNVDLVNAAVNFKQAEMMSRVQFAVARKLLDAQSQQGAAAVKLIDAAGKIASQAGDEMVAAATGLGGSLDTYG